MTTLRAVPRPAPSRSWPSTRQGHEGGQLRRRPRRRQPRPRRAGHGARGGVRRHRRRGRARGHRDRRAGVRPRARAKTSDGRPPGRGHRRRCRRPCGIGGEAFWTGLNGAPPEGERRVHDFDPEPYFDNPKEARRADRFAQFALAAAAEALEQVGRPRTATPSGAACSSAPASVASTPSRSRSSSTTRRAPGGSRRSWCR